MRSRLLWLPVSVLVSGIVTGCTTRSTPVLTRERVVPYAQPAVVKVQAIGDFEVTGPTGARTKKQHEPSTNRAPLPRARSLSDLLSGSQRSLWHSTPGNRSGSSLPSFGGYSDYLPPARSLVMNEYERDRSAGVIEASVSRSEYCWEKIAEAPEKYLRASQERETRQLENVSYGHGSGFAVSREGIILTNAHVVADPEGVLPSVELLAQPVTATLQELSREFGGDPPPALEQKLLARLVSWFAGQMSVKGTFKEARVILDHRKQVPSLNSIRSLLGRLDVKLDPAIENREQSVAARVKAIGTPLPGKDVAVLSVDLPDRLICLRLGDSDTVEAGSTVHAMGFPGAAILEGMMEEGAAYRVISHDGIVDQKMPMVGGWQAFHMTADINHGDSGGPVLDDEGRVIGLNVGGNPDEPAQNLAVPIHVAKEFLAQAGVKPDPGPVSEQWLRGQQEYARKNYSRAYQAFKEVRRLQNGGQEPLLVSFTGPRTNEYVTEMMDQCRKLGNLPH